jgi:hypothetical protein
MIPKPPIISEPMTRLIPLLLLILLAGCASEAQFRFALIGDLGYRAEEEPLVENVFRELDAAPLAFVVHDGDLSSPGAGSCSEALWAKRLAQFQASAHPLVYTPGDNEWTDCHEGQGVRGGDPLERLRALRETFFRNPEALGRRKMPLERQSGEYPENARWERGGIVFLTLHVPGSNNGRGRSPGGDVEFAARNRADMAWLRAGFERAKTSGARAVMIVQQANMYPEYPPFPGEGPKEPSGFTELRTLLAREALAFGKPVVLVHGDSHYFRVDKPLARRSSSPMVENLTRVETFGSPYHHWVEVSVDPADANVFTFRPRIVAANLKGGK